MVISLNSFVVLVTFWSFVMSKKLPPWVVQSNYSQGIDGLHEEVENFYQFIAPTEEEKFTRDDFLARTQKVVKDLRPDLPVNVFGSSRIGIFFHDSDVDMAIPWNATSRSTLEIF